MFDPTAFDNMKVVIEGALYDLDIVGQIMIVDRNDIINVAKMSRRFDISFKLKDDTRHAYAKLIMESELVNLAAELIPESQSKNLSGCHISLQFTKDGIKENEDFTAIAEMLKKIWGETRTISQIIQYEPEAENSFTTVITLKFDRLIGEELIDDLVDMTDFIIETLKRL